MSSQIRTKIIALVEEVAEQPLGSIGHGEDLLVSGYLDSFGFVQLLLAMNSELGVEISEDMQLDPRLRTIDGLVDIIEHV